jgi:hypothetical protein
MEWILIGFASYGVYSLIMEFVKWIQIK